MNYTHIIIFQSSDRNSAKESQPYAISRLTLSFPCQTDIATNIWCYFIVVFYRISQSIIV